MKNSRRPPSVQVRISVDLASIERLLAHARRLHELILELAAELEGEEWKDGVAPDEAYLRARPHSDD